MTEMIWPFILIILTSISSIIALRNFDLILTDSKCTVKNNYVTGVSCVVNKTDYTNPPLYIYGQMQKEVRDLRVDFSIDLIRRNDGTMVTFFKINNLDGCKFVYENTTLPMLKILGDILLKYGDWPRHCPVPAGYEYKYMNVTLDPELLPTFVPNTDFSITIKLYDKKLKFWDVEVNGKLSHKGKNKPNRKL